MLTTNVIRICAIPSHHMVIWELQAFLESNQNLIESTLDPPFLFLINSVNFPIEIRFTFALYSDNNLLHFERFWDIFVTIGYQYYSARYLLQFWEILRYFCDNRTLLLLCNCVSLQGQPNMNIIAYLVFSISDTDVWIWYMMIR